MDTVACPECDLLQRIPELPPGGKARCPRCGNTLATRPIDPLDRPLALTIAAAVVFIVAHTTPLMDLSAVGRHASTTIAGGALQMWQTGEPITAIVVAFCAGTPPGPHPVHDGPAAVRRPPAPIGSESCGGGTPWSRGR
jgi:paraquat-inducible protein A